MWIETESPAEVLIGEIATFSHQNSSTKSYNPTNYSEEFQALMISNFLQETAQ